MEPGLFDKEIFAVSIAARDICPKDQIAKLSVSI